MEECTNWGAVGHRKLGSRDLNRGLTGCLNRDLNAALNRGLIEHLNRDLFVDPNGCLIGILNRHLIMNLNGDKIYV